MFLFLLVLWQAGFFFLSVFVFHLRLNLSTGISGTMFNLFNSTFGAGLLGFGIVYLQIGLILATFLATLVGIAQVVSNYLLLRAAEKTKARSMSVVAYHNFGLVGSVLLDLVLILSTFGCLCACKILIEESLYSQRVLLIDFILYADFMLPVAAAFLSPTSLLATDRVVAMLFVGLLGVLPLSLKPTINSLQTFAILSMFLFSLVVLAMIIICAQGISGGMVVNPANLGQLTVSSFGGVSIIVL
jgi:hypothetical protein